MRYVHRIQFQPWFLKYDYDYFWSTNTLFLSVGLLFSGSSINEIREIRLPKFFRASARKEMRYPVTYK